MITTLGSGVAKGSLYSLDANIMLNFLEPASSLGFECIFSMDGTVWTADCNSAGTHAALGYIYSFFYENILIQDIVSNEC
jgi:hypothetical protein